MFVDLGLKCSLATSETKIREKKLKDNNYVTVSKET